MFTSIPTNRSPMHQNSSENNESPIIEHAICYHPNHNYTQVIYIFI